MTRPASRAAVVLTVLTLVFLARVAGQALVVFFGVTWLPPPDSWYSGLLPYPLLLPTQILILIAQSMMDRAAWTGRPSFHRPRPRASRALRWLSYAYALAMAARYAITRTHSIPIIVHWILAAYLHTLSGVWRDRGESVRSRTSTQRRAGVGEAGTRWGP